jgi:Leucine-rich repeat (LRR) protein
MEPQSPTLPLTEPDRLGPTSLSGQPPRAPEQAVPPPQPVRNSNRMLLLIGVAIALVILTINVIVVLVISRDRSGGGNTSRANGIANSSPVSSLATRRIPTNSPLWLPSSTPSRPTPPPIQYYTPYPTRDYTPYPTRDYSPYPSQPPVTSRPTRRATNVAAIVWFINNMTLANRTIAAPTRSYYGDDYYNPSSGLAEEDAVEWLVERDPLQLLPFEPVDQFRLQQRYVLLTMRMQPIYDSSLLNETMQQTLENECLWDGVSCAPLDLGDEIGTKNVVTQIRFATVNAYSTLPADIGLLSHLTSLDATYPYYYYVSYSALPDSIGRLSNLVHFNVSGQFYGTIPESVGDWTKIQTLSLRGLTITGTLPASIGQWTDIREFNVSGNQLDGTLPHSTWVWANISKIDLSSNLFTGGLPSSGSQWTALEYIDLSRNYYNGTLPEAMAEWSNLRMVNLFGLYLTGTLPSWIGHWENLEHIDFSCMGMDGTLPESIGNWSNVVRVNLSYNNFTGSLPESIGEWTNVQEFYISNNVFRGTIPDAVANWVAIRQLVVAENALTGSIPIDLCQASNVTSIQADCDEVQCACCTHCFTAATAQCPNPQLLSW